MNRCATCHRTYDPDGRGSWRWDTRPDGKGLMCWVCQRRGRRGEPLDREPTPPPTSPQTPGRRA